MHLAIQNRTLTSTQSETNACVDDSEEVLIPEGVEMIGRNAFLCCNEISHVQLPESLTAIHAGAFQHCYNLKEIRIPEHVEEIHEEAFAYCMKSAGGLGDCPSAGTAGSVCGISAGG